MFVDRVELICRGGDGGNGCLSFRREAKVPRGGPDGGDGGDGGSVILCASENVTNLAHLFGHKHWTATPGVNGGGSMKSGRGGEDLLIEVPVGTLVYDAGHDNLLRDLKEHGEKLVIAKGGRGGRGNWHFKSATNRAPREFEHGAPGEQRSIRLDLKLIADVGLVGKPNAGKSTLLSRLSRATPEIAPYPFTTKYPNLGVVYVGYERQYLLADIPGLIEGAHQGIGLGHEFLRHVERTRVFVHLIEPAPMDETDPVENYRAIRDELRLYDVALAERPELIVVTKCELPEAAAIVEALKKETGRPVMTISAVTGKGLPELNQAIIRLLDGKVDDDWKPPVRSSAR